MDNHAVTINGITYLPTVRRGDAPDFARAKATMDAAPGSLEREAGLEYFERLYRIRDFHGPRSPEREAAMSALAARHGAVHIPGSDKTVRRVTFQLVRHLARRPERRHAEAVRREVERYEARRAADCAAAGCCPA